MPEDNQVTAAPDGAGGFGAELRRARTALALSQEDLADASGVAVRTISDLERGVARRPRSATVRLLAAALGLSGDELAAFRAAARAWRSAAGSGAGDADGAGDAGDAGQAEPGGRPASLPQRPAPRMLPRDIGSFTGREAELDALIGAADAARRDGAVGVCVVEGMGGVGKTALVLRAAHLVADRFGDGQLFIDLQGFTPGVAPLDPADALRSLLVALGVRREAIPEQLAERAALYRSMLAGTRALVILDNAASAAQVEPLLPGTAGCLVLATSRRTLDALDDARVIALGALPPDKAARLFRVVAGARRASTDDPDVAEITELCGYLPLAIRIVAARLARRQALLVAEVLAELRSEHRRLGQFTDGERSVAAAFELSFNNLPALVQETFEQIGLVPGPDFDVLAAASLVGEPDLAAVQERLDWLLAQNLLLAGGGGRYRFHDLVRDFARAKSAAADQAGLDRLLDYYLFAAHQADQRLERRSFVRVAPLPYEPDKPQALPDLASEGLAVAWLTAELRNLAAALHTALRLGRPGYAVALSESLAVYLRVNGPWSLAAELHGGALDAATRLGDPALAAGTLAHIGLIEFQLGQLGAAEATLTRAAGGFREAGDRTGEADALTNLALVLRVAGQLDRAATCLQTAVGLYRADGAGRGEASVLRELGMVQRQAGQFGDAERSLSRALELFGEAGYRYGEASVLAYLGGVRLVVRDYEPARSAIEAALAIYRRLDDPVGQANCLLFLGKAHLDEGALGSAEAALAQAGDLYGKMGDRRGRAGVLAFLGDTQRLAGENRKAERSLAEALRLFHEISDPGGEAETMNMYAAVALAGGTADVARQRYARGLRLARQVESPRDEADALEGIASTHRAEGRVAAARRQYARALAGYEAMNCAADADRVRTALAALPG